MTDVARIAGVSHQTVSRVLNGSGRVAEETRRKVLDAIEQTGYRRNSVARALARNRSETIGVVSTSGLFHGPMSTLLAVEVAARTHGYYTVVAPVDDDDPGAVRAVIDHFLSLPVDGVVLISPVRDVAADLANLSLPVPVVAVTAADPGPGCGVITISIDQQAGARAAMEHLLDLGHTDIAHVPGPRSYFEARIRCRVWRGMLEDRGLAVREPHDGGWEFEVGYREGLRMHAQGLPTAVFCANDQSALGLYRAFGQLGVRIPQEVSVVGFDDMPAAAHYLPSLTTIGQDFTRMGRRAVDALVRAIDEGEAVETSMLAPTLVVRESTAPPRTG
ncbi:LacI family DNA-binding transcriptional regulator [Schaalia sp. 19OD2882]|uniref:LacI family DNA-binding transcriptional regulator n=1 Tax=Schaalia sp. 19OD2882 TaxID=2794089 RepID=UPI001C1EDE89|nr:LacI family DNA-binding transcriptional regulator [Schaalia sp. 19OD2882]QWW20167.1 LacI family DNA-binding transcriptional regulator [Schaalia sp. 19OD2882]